MRTSVEESVPPSGFSVERAQKPLIVWYNKTLRRAHPTENKAVNLTDRITDIRTRVRAAAEAAGRDPTEITLLAATKTVPVDVILAAARLGITDIGENRVQEAQAKRAALAAAPLVHHFIGQLQTNKARTAVSLFDVIQSVDRLRLAESIARAADEAGKRQRVLIEVKISDEHAKGGVAPAEADALIDAAREMPSLDVVGVMAIAPFDRPEAETRAAFRRAADVFRRNRAKFGEAPILSMGMTDDFEWAIAEGSTMVRVGRALFGEREKNG